jgi:hypothetical protein
MGDYRYYFLSVFFDGFRSPSLPALRGSEAGFTPYRAGEARREKSRAGSFRSKALSGNYRKPPVFHGIPDGNSI